MKMLDGAVRLNDIAVSTSPDVESLMMTGTISHTGHARQRENVRRGRGHIPHPRAKRHSPWAVQTHSCGGEGKDSLRMAKNSEDRVKVSPHIRVGKSPLHIVVDYISLEKSNDHPRASHQQRLQHQGLEGVPERGGAYAIAAGIKRLSVGCKRDATNWQRVQRRRVCERVPWHPVHHGDSSRLSLCMMRPKMNYLPRRAGRFI